MKVYDFVIIGGGVAGLTFSYMLRSVSNNASFIVLEKGNFVENRTCSYIETGKCCSHSQCAILYGVGGGGLYSDGKVIENSGWYIKDFSTDILSRVSSILLEKILSTHPNYIRYDPFAMENLEEIVSNIMAYGFSIYPRKIYWYGTEEVKILTRNLSNRIRDRLCVNTALSVRKINNLYAVKTQDKEFIARNVVMATGRYCDWRSLLQNIRIEYEKADPHVGIRVEMLGNPFEVLTSIFYDLKLAKYGLRTFCFNPYGFVLLERRNPYEISVNGYSMRYKKSSWTNFAIIGPTLPYYKTNIPLYLDLKKFMKDSGKSRIEGTLGYKRYSEELLTMLPRQINSFMEDLLNLVNVKMKDIEGYLYYPEVKLSVAKPHIYRFESKENEGLFFIGESTGKIVGIWASMISAILLVDKMLANR
jgi:uncharacterized FAD-dependent dehydrogenase